MLVISPSVSNIHKYNSLMPRVSFGDRDSEEYDADELKDTVRGIHNDLKGTMEEFEEVTPGFVKKALKVLSVITAGVIGFIGMKWASGHLVESASKAAKNEKLREFLGVAEKTVKPVADKAKTEVSVFGNWLNKTKFGKKLFNAYNSSSKFVKGKYQAVRGKIKKIITNTIGVAGGTATAVKTGKEEVKAEEDNKE